MPRIKQTPLWAIVGETVAWSVPLFGGLLYIVIKAGALEWAH